LRDDFDMPRAIALFVARCLTLCALAGCALVNPAPPPVIDVSPGVTPPRPISEAVDAAMTVITGSEAWLGRSLVPARIVKVSYHPDATGGAHITLRDGRPDPHGRGMGGAWVVEVEGTLARATDGAYFPGGLTADTGAGIGQLGSRGWIVLEETRDGLHPNGLLMAPCWTLQPLDASFMDGECPGP
jgi:hypothetical protein